QRQALADMAKIACLSPHHFLRLFKHAFQETPHQYLTRKRLEWAQDLLTSTERSITDICVSIGFESLGSFSWLFRRRFGASPDLFRRRGGSGSLGGRPIYG
ncbi:MAG: helix-turn-helix transcriptional regulator, partial [Bacteroidota bacterium]